jgi:DNA repair protein RadC
VTASTERLLAIPGAVPASISLIGSIRRAMVTILTAEFDHGPVIPSASATIDYLMMTMAHEPIENFRVLFLNGANWLLADELIGRGSIDAAPVSARDIVRRALELGATRLICAHNHPSGNPVATRADVRVTREIADAARLFDIQLLDHLIIARGGYASLEAEGLL